MIINSGELITEIAGGANLVEGKQTWEHAEEKKHDIECMKKCCDAELRTMKKTGLVPAPYYFERVAILSRKERNYQQETDYCELYINTVENFYKKRGTKGVADVRNGPTYKAIVKRLPRAKELQDNHSSQAKPEPARSQPKPRLEKPQEQAKKNWPAIGKKRIEAKQYKEAVAALCNALKTDLNNEKVYYLRAVAYSKSGDRQNALEDIKTAARLGHPKAIEYLQKKAAG